MREEIIERANRNIGGFIRFINNNIDYFNEIKNNIPYYSGEMLLSEMVYYYINNIKDINLCICGKKKKFIGLKNGYHKTCGNNKCSSDLRKSTNIVKYGVDNPMKSKEIKERATNTLFENYGVIVPMKSDEVKNNFKKTMLENHGVEWAQQNKEIAKKSIDTWKNNPNRENIIKKRNAKFLDRSLDQKNEINNKRNNTIIENWGSRENYTSHINNQIKVNSLAKYGVDHPMSLKYNISKRVNSYSSSRLESIIKIIPDDIKYISRSKNINGTDYVFKLFCVDCNREFDINRQYLLFRSSLSSKLCLHCNPILHGKSKAEEDVYNFIKSIYSQDIIRNSKSIIDGLELDIYLPEKNLAFEFNGLYWHSEEQKDKFYHLKKLNVCNERGIRLIQIWEDDWLYKQEIVKSRISNLVIGSQKLYARKCEVRDVSYIESNKFLNENHIQGNVQSKIRLGLYYNDELLSLMTFGGLRRSLGQIVRDNHYELLRFCNKLNNSVVGGASRLFIHFIRNNNPISIISYSDKCWSSGDLYENLGFEYMSETGPNYWWVDPKDIVRYNRFKFRKDVLVKNGYDSNLTEIQIMHSMGYLRLFDCGSDKWIYKNNKPELNFDPFTVKTQLEK